MEDSIDGENIGLLFKHDKGIHRRRFLVLGVLFAFKWGCQCKLRAYQLNLGPRFSQEKITALGLGGNRTNNALFCRQVLYSSELPETVA